jgi:hypothetical protein
VTRNEYSVIGGASKLFKCFLKNYNPDYIYTYQEIRTSLNSNFYENLGFKYVGTSTIDYKYSNSEKLYHRGNFKKQKLISKGYDKNKTEKQIMFERGFYRIESFGHKKYQLDNKKGLPK